MQGTLFIKNGAKLFSKTKCLYEMIWCFIAKPYKDGYNQVQIECKFSAS